MTTKREVVLAVKEIVEGMTYHPNIHWPDYGSINTDRCREIAPYFKNDLVDELVVLSTIYDSVRVVAQTQDHSPVTSPETTRIVGDVYSFLKSLPRKYVFLFPLPEGTIADKALNSDIKLRKVDEVFSQSLTRHQTVNQSISSLRRLLGDAMNGLHQPIIKEGANILEVKASGYVNNLTITRLYGTDPLFAFKVVVGAYIAEGVFENSPQHTSNPYGVVPSYSFYSYDNSQGLEFLRRFDESNDDKKLLDRYIFKSELYNYNWTNEALVKLFSSQRLNFVKNIQAQLKNGLYWYYEANKSNLSHFQAVYIVSALDSFFAKDDNSNHKASVIAAAIADDFKWESQIKKYIPQLYTLRNDIVHGQKAIGVYNQTPEAQALENFLIWKCQAILRQFLAYRLKAFHDLP
jgi:hypothetical protein